MAKVSNPNICPTPSIKITEELIVYESESESNASAKTIEYESDETTTNVPLIINRWALEHDNILRVYCCTNAFQSLTKLLQHMEVNHFAELRTCIRSNKDLVIKCLSEDNLLPCVEEILELPLELESKSYKSFTKPEVVDFKEVFQPVLPIIKDTEPICNDELPEVREEMGTENILVSTRNELTLSIKPITLPFEIRGSQQQQKHQEQTREEETAESFTCELCPSTFPTKPDLLCHIRDKHVRKRNPNLKCKFCFESFTVKEKYDKHLLEHQNEPARICDTCGRSFTGIKNFEKHTCINKTKRIFHCSVCSKGFPAELGRKYHQINVHGIGEPSDICTVCGKGFANPGDLRNHEINHSDARPFQCPECPLAFKRANHLKSHKLTNHTADLPKAKCLMCPSQLKNTEVLRMHYRKVHQITINEAYKQAGIAYNGRDIISSKFIQNRIKNKNK